MRRWLSIGRKCAIVTTVAGVMLTCSAAAVAVDSATFYAGCGSGATCFAQTNFGGSYVVYSSYRDSYLTDNTYQVGGGIINDRARYARNTFNTLTICVNQAYDYVGANWVLGPGTTSGLLPFNQPTGVSSEKSC
jgi:hypothetical protein